MERGNKVGDNVLIEVEHALKWPDGWCYRILDGKVDGPPTPGKPVRDRTNTTLEDASVDELLDEVAFRRQAGRVTG